MQEDIKLSLPTYSIIQDPKVSTESTRKPLDMILSSK